MFRMRSPLKWPFYGFFTGPILRLQCVRRRFSAHFCSTMATFEAQVISFNNAGVDYLNQGEPGVACDLFKAALEVQLAYQRGENSTAAKEVETSVRVEVAQQHLRNLVTHVADESPAHGRPFGLFSVTMDSTNPVPEASGVFKPFLYEKPFRIQDSIATRTRSRTRCCNESMETMHSAIVIFNLALVHHLYSRSSRHAIEYYRLVATLVEGEQTEILGAALINNIGVWCSENGDVDGAQRCMESLSHIVQDSHPANRDNELDGFLLNVRWLLAPPLSASPAA